MIKQIIYGGIIFFTFVGIVYFLWLASLPGGKKRKKIKINRNELVKKLDKQMWIGEVIFMAIYFIFLIYSVSFTCFSLFFLIILVTNIISFGATNKLLKDWRVY